MPKDIRDATLKNCVDYQRTAAGFAADAAYYRDEARAMPAAIQAQEHAREYHDAAWLRLDRLI